MKKKNFVTDDFNTSIIPLPGEKWYSLGVFADENYTDYYELSTMGRVKSVKKNKILKPWNDKDGYYRIDLFKNGSRKTVRIHVLVATKFLPNEEGLPVINHKDENKHNNCVDNLEWCTVKYNATYGTSIAKRKETCKKKKLNICEYNNRPIAMLSKEGELLKVYEELDDVIKDGFNKAAVMQCASGTIELHGGYKWVIFRNYEIKNRFFNCVTPLTK